MEISEVARTKIKEMLDENPGKYPRVDIRGFG
jgi:hypothetical protein